MAKSLEDRVRAANDAILGKGDLEVVDEVFSADYVAHIGGKDFRGTGFVRRFAGQLRKALPNLGVVKVEVLMQHGDTIAWQRTLRGTHEADLKGLPPSGKRVTWTDMVVSRFEGGKIVEEWAVSDLAGQMFAKLG